MTVKKRRKNGEEQRRKTRRKITGKNNGERQRSKTAEKEPAANNRLHQGPLINSLTSTSEILPERGFPDVFLFQDFEWTRNIMTLLLTGNLNRKEFQEAVDFFDGLKQQNPSAVRYFSSVDDLDILAESGENFEPELCVLFADYPERFGDSFWRQIRTRFPLTRFLLLSGALCQGEERTGSQEQGIVRAPWYLWRDFTKEEVLKFLNGEKSVFSLEETALFEDQVRTTNSYDSLTEMTDPEMKISTVEIASDDMSMRDLLRDMILDASSNSETATVISRSIICRTLDDLFQTHKTPANETPAHKTPANETPVNKDCDYFIIDTIDSASPILAQKIRKLAEENPLAKIDLLIAGPNPEELEDFEKIPGCRIVPKPFFSKIFDSRR